MPSALNRRWSTSELEWVRAAPLPVSHQPGTLQSHRQGRARPTSGLTTHPEVNVNPADKVLHRDTTPASDSSCQMAHNPKASRIHRPYEIWLKSGGSPLESEGVEARRPIDRSRSNSSGASSRRKSTTACSGGEVIAVKIPSSLVQADQLDQPGHRP